MGVTEQGLVEQIVAAAHDKTLQQFGHDASTLGRTITDHALTSPKLFAQQSLDPTMSAGYTSSLSESESSLTWTK